jgi:hypothetical protein
MSVWELCIGETIRTNDGIRSSQEATEALVEIELLCGYNIIKSKDQVYRVQNAKSLVV